jgi:glycosyltransferase involved in cell wall biosynthesis
MISRTCLTEDQDTKAIKASVIIPAHNAAATIVLCIRSVLPQAKNYDAEVILVDSSHDGTREIVQKLFPEVRVIALQKKTPSAVARNLGAQAARTNLLIFLDADCIPRDGWLHGIRESDFNEVAAVGGSVGVYDRSNLLGLQLHFLEFSESLPCAQRRFVDRLPSCNLACQREAFERVGGFPVEYEASHDMLLTWRLSRGGRLLFEPSLRVDHVNKRGWRPVYHHAYRLGYWSGRLWAKYPFPRSRVVRWRCFLPIIPFARTLVLHRRLWPRDKGLWCLWVLTMPLYLSVVTGWTIGFAVAMHLRENLKST